MTVYYWVIPKQFQLHLQEEYEQWAIFSSYQFKEAIHIQHKSIGLYDQ